MATFHPSVSRTRPAANNRSPVLKGYSKVSQKQPQESTLSTLNNSSVKPDLFNNPNPTMQAFRPQSTESGAPFSVEFALLTFEEQLFKCQLGEISHEELQSSFQDIQEKILMQISRQKRSA